MKISFLWLLFWIIDGKKESMKGFTFFSGYAAENDDWRWKKKYLQ